MTLLLCMYFNAYMSHIRSTKLVASQYAETKLYSGIMQVLLSLSISRLSIYPFLHHCSLQSQPLHLLISDPTYLSRLNYRQRTNLLQPKRVCPRIIPPILDHPLLRL
jgi:hypothetical protein